jgi:hypothetical protein
MALAVALSASAFAAEGFVGKYKTTDTDGKPLPSGCRITAVPKATGPMRACKACGRKKATPR